ncbi:MAG: hypothetical protein Q4G34_08800 [Micrococcus sp.]|nr:hypothetical protein [Micrococcus sp.]
MGARTGAAQTQWRFGGHILGVGTASGTRLVVGMWRGTPLGDFADVMVQHDDGHRLLLAPTEAVAEFVSATYHFDEVRIEPVRAHVPRPARAGAKLTVETDTLQLTATLGRRSPLGWGLRALPRPVASHPGFSMFSDPIARLMLRGVRTRGSAGSGRREYYGALDAHTVRAVRANWEGTDLGALRRVEPATTFGFSSTPPAPTLTRIVTTVVF